MSEFQDNTLRIRLAGFASGRDDGDWRDVVRRARSAHRRRIAGAVGIAAVIVVGAASAFALTHPTVNFLSSSKGTQKVVDDFGREQVMSPPGMGPGVLPNQARRITEVKFDGKDHVLYVAPTKAGGFCYQWMGGGCRASRAGSEPRLGVGGLGGPNGLTVLQGAFLQSNGARLVVSYADGSTSTIPFVWVTSPINAGFYLFRIPDAHRKAGHQPTSVALYDSSGKLIERDGPLPGVGQELGPAVHPRIAGFPPLPVPRSAIYSKRQQLFDFRADNGTRVGLWIAPEKGGGTCFWANRSSGCDQGRVAKLPPDFSKLHPKLEHAGPVLGLGLMGGHTVFLCCQVDANVARVELRFQDGDRIELTPKQTYLITAIPTRHYPLGHRITSIVGYDAAGKQIAIHALGNQAGVYPCTKPKNLGYGVTECP